MDATLKSLSDFLRRSAEEMIVRYGGFAPIGAYVTAAYECVLLRGYTPELQPDASVVVDRMVAEARKLAADQTIQAAGICYEPTRIDADTWERKTHLTLHLESIDGSVLEVDCPSMRELNGEVTHAPNIVRPARRFIFSSISGSAS